MFMGLDGHRTMREIEFENKKRSADERLRDEFAMAALTGLVASPLVKNLDNVNDVAGLSYEIADAMMEARK